MHALKHRGFNVIREERRPAYPRIPKVMVQSHRTMNNRLRRQISTGCNNLPGRKLYLERMANSSMEQAELRTLRTFAFRYFSPTVPGTTLFWSEQGYLKACKGPTAPAFRRSLGWMHGSAPPMLHHTKARGGNWPFRVRSDNMLPTVLTGGPRLPEFQHSGLLYHTRSIFGADDSDYSPMLVPKFGAQWITGANLNSRIVRLSPMSFVAVLSLDAKFRWYRRAYQAAIRFGIEEVDNDIPTHAAF